MVALVPWIIVGVLIILTMIAAAIWVWKSDKRKMPDFYGFFIMGVVWAIIAIPLGSYPLFALGMVFAVTGLANKRKWKKPVPWKKMKPVDRMNKILFFTLLVLLFIAGLFVLFCANDFFNLYA